MNNMALMTNEKFLLSFSDGHHVLLGNGGKSVNTFKIRTPQLQKKTISPQLFKQKCLNV